MNNQWLGEPTIKKYFKEKNLIEQPVYESNIEYKPIYINKKLYEEIFDKTYNWEEAKDDISKNFSLTLDINKSNKAQTKGKAYVDKQYDPLDIALNGNIGSGRAYFYEKYFNIKGDKTILATSKNKKYSNGKLSLPHAIRECITSNILADDFIYPSFETLAILYKKEQYNFSKKVIQDNRIIEFDNELPCALIIRVSAEKKFYRFTNAFSNKENFSKEDLIEMSQKIGKLEANKFIDRFLHGSWSGGNLSLDMNLIDFDGAFFVKGRHPQYSVTPWHKNNYFGNELLGQMAVIKSIVDNGNILEEIDFDELENTMKRSYSENIVARFCDLIGMDYEVHYNKYKEKIDRLALKFNELSRKFLPNYSELSISEDYCNSTFLFDFSKFFRFYLINKSRKNYTDFDGLMLISNKTVRIEEDFDEEIISNIKEFFKDEIIQNEKESNQILKEIIDFIKEYDKLFNEIIERENIEDLLIKSYIVNEDRKYLYGNYDLADRLTKEYVDEEFCEEDINIIVDHVIELNKRNYNFNAEKEFKTNLMIYKDCITYFKIGKSYYYFVIKPFKDSNIQSAKIIINDKQFEMNLDKNENIFITEKIEDTECYTTILKNIKIIFNNIEYDKRPL